MAGELVFRLLKPVIGQLIEHLSLKRNRCNELVEGAQSVGDDDNAPVAAHIAITHFPPLELAHILKCRFVQRPIRVLPTVLHLKPYSRFLESFVL